MRKWKWGAVVALGAVLSAYVVSERFGFPVALDAEAKASGRIENLGSLVSLVGDTKNTPIDRSMCRRGDTSVEQLYLGCFSTKKHSPSKCSSLKSLNLIQEQANGVIPTVNMLASGEYPNISADVVCWQFPKILHVNFVQIASGIADYGEPWPLFRPHDRIGLIGRVRGCDRSLGCLSALIQSVAEKDYGPKTYPSSQYTEASHEPLGQRILGKKPPVKWADPKMGVVGFLILLGAMLIVGMAIAGVLRWIAEPRERPDEE